jgi:enoyl-CoA hydratase
VSRSNLIFEHDGPLAYVTFNRPEFHNALTWEMYDGLLKACEKVEADPNVRVLILRGADGASFAAGTDISQFQELHTPEDVLEYGRRIEKVLGRLEAVTKPTIAAIAGYALGGGALIAVACDLRYCTPESKIGIPVARTLGNCLSLANYARLVNVLGSARVKELIFRARLVGGEEACQIGLANEVVQADQLHERVREVAMEMVSHSPITIRVTKEAIRRLQAYRQPTEGDDLILQAYMSEDFKERVKAFLGRRDPKFRDQ